MKVDEQPNPQLLQKPPTHGPARVVPAAGLTIDDHLTLNEFRDGVRPNAPPCKVYPVRMIAGRTYTIDMVSMEFDAYLRLENAEFVNLGEDDDSGGNLNARIFFAPPQTGTYRVIATSFDAQPGRFTLLIRSQK